MIHEYFSYQVTDKFHTPPPRIEIAITVRPIYTSTIPPGGM